MIGVNLEIGEDLPESDLDLEVCVEKVKLGVLEPPLIPCVALKKASPLRNLSNLSTQAFW